jgi:hypothetical protein
VINVSLVPPDTSGALQGSNVLTGQLKQLGPEAVKVPRLLCPPATATYYYQKFFFLSSLPPLLPQICYIVSVCNATPRSISLVIMSQPTSTTSSTSEFVFIDTPPAKPLAPEFDCGVRTTNVSNGQLNFGSLLAAPGSSGSPGELPGHCQPRY